LEVYKRLYELCCANNIDLQVIYGNPSYSDSKKRDAVDFEYGIYKENCYLSAGRLELIWQPVLAQIRQKDLVIVEQANKLLINYILMAQQVLGWQKFAFWGHGKNFQATQCHLLSERLKRLMICRPHWWFAYTPAVARYVASQGFPADRITTLFNTIDTSALVEFRRNISTADLEEAKIKIGGSTRNVCLYIGGMYPEKRIRFLLDACIKVRELISDFRMIFIGAGTDGHLVTSFCETYPWAVYLESVFGQEKVKYFALSKLLLMPGLVGLAVLDAFALEVPIVTTSVAFHSPEIEYVENERNGIIVDPPENVDLYASKIVDLLSDASKRATLVNGCRIAASRYTIDKMVNNFFGGIVQALAT